MIQFRPDTFDGIVGNENLKRCLKISVSIAIKENKPVSHLLLSGTSGCGKTTLARALAKARGTNFIESNAAAIKKSEDLLSLITKTKENDVLFIDEIHSLKQKHEEILYIAMEDFKLPLNTSNINFLSDEQLKDLNNLVNLKLYPFTLVGATTNPGALSAPLRNRFQLKQTVKLYTVEEIEQIIINSANLIKIKLDKDASAELAKRSKLTPRIANGYLRWLYDYITFDNRSYASKQDVISAMELMNVDEFGYDVNDRAYVEALIELGCVGISNIAAKTGISIDTIRKDIEPYLLHTNVIKITGGGRMLTNFEIQNKISGFDPDLL